MSAEFYYPGIEQYSDEERRNIGSAKVERVMPLIKADRLAYLIFERPDLNLQESFLQDFGLLTATKTDDALFMRGRDTEPFNYVALRGEQARYLGAGFTVNSYEELEVLAANAEPTASIEPITWPGGGSRVRLADPDGFMIDVVYGRKPVDVIKVRNTPLPHNTPFNKVRVNSGQRPDFAPTNIVRLGHTLHMVTDFDRSLQWYMRHLGIIPTDVLCLEDGTPNLAFARMDRGDLLADHHTLVVTGGPEAGLLHAAFEALDIDEIGQGQQFLKNKGWDHHWGIGRHILGSQIFDYWRDPYGTELEHYADGDVFTADHETQYYPLDRGGLWQWGQDLPPAQMPDLPDKLLQDPSALEYLLKLGKAMTRMPRPWLAEPGVK